MSLLTKRPAECLLVYASDLTGDDYRIFDNSASGPKLRSAFASCTSGVDRKSLMSVQISADGPQRITVFYQVVAATCSSDGLA